MSWNRFLFSGFFLPFQEVENGKSRRKGILTSLSLSSRIQNPTSNPRTPQRASSTTSSPASHAPTSGRARRGHAPVALCLPRLLPPGALRRRCLRRRRARVAAGDRGRVAAAHRALFEEKGKASRRQLDFDFLFLVGALVEAAAFWSILRSRLDEEWWLEAARLREALAAELGAACARRGRRGRGRRWRRGDAPRPPAADALLPGGRSGLAASPRPPSRRRSSAPNSSSSSLSLSRSPSSALLPRLRERACGLGRSRRRCPPRRWLATRRAHEESASSTSPLLPSRRRAAVPRSLVLSCALGPR